jgi:hypothetical protein
MNRIIGLFVAIVVCGWSIAADPPQSLDKARTLVQSLGDRSFRTREKANDELVRMGREAYAAVAEGANHSDAEIRCRCQKILPAILDQELKARLDAFLSDTDGKHEHALPGWKRFCSQFGNTAANRSLFANLIRADMRAMEETENSTVEVATMRLQARCQVLQQHQMMAANTGMGATISLRDIVQAMFLATRPGLDLPIVTAQYITMFTYQATFHQGISNSENSDVIRKLTVAWFEKRLDDPNTCYAIQNLASRFKFSEAAPVVSKLVGNKKATPHVRAVAITTLGVVGGKDDAKFLEPFLEDTTLVGNYQWNNFKGTTQLGDVALAQVIRLHGKKPGDFGFSILKANPNFANSYFYQGFANDQERSAARKLWRDEMAKK